MAKRIRRLVRCQNRECRSRVVRSVALELPGNWLGVGLADLPATRVYVGLCPGCARDVERAARSMREAHRRFATAMAATDREAEALRRNAELQVHLAESRALAEYVCGLGAGVEYELDVMRHERDVLQRAYVRLLRRSGSTVQIEDARRDLGLSA